MSRKPPVAIISDEGEDNQASPIRPSKNGRKPPCLAESAPRPHHKHCDQEDDEDSESGSGYTHLVPDIPSDGVDEADGDDDLRGLGNEELASVLASEVMFYILYQKSCILFYFCSVSVGLQSPTRTTEL